MMVRTSRNENAFIAAAALKLAARAGWVDVTIDAIARETKQSVNLFRKRFVATTDLVPLIAEEIDREAFAAVSGSGMPHDVLFDLLMARFDVLQKHRKAILSMAEAARRDPRLARALACATIDGIYRVIDAAQADEKAIPPRPVFAAGVGAIYGFAFHVWRKDESRDMAKTMAAVDRGLRFAGKAATFIKRRA
jgi:ubiquinone biosynthesis protein COQ9